MTFDKNTPLPFGKYRGTPVKDVPASYLLWWHDARRRDDWLGLKLYIDQNMDVLKNEVENNKNK